MKNLWIFVLFAIVAASLLVGGCSSFKHQSQGFILDAEKSGKRCVVSQDQLDAEIETSGGYEITAEEFCNL